MLRYVFTVADYSLSFSPKSIIRDGIEAIIIGCFFFVINTFLITIITHLLTKQQQPRRRSTIIAAPAHRDATSSNDIEYYFIRSSIPPPSCHLLKDHNPRRFYPTVVYHVLLSRSRYQMRITKLTRTVALAMRPCTRKS